MAEFYETFNNHRYQNDGQVLRAPGDDVLANAGMVIQFVHIPTGNIINFKAFIESFTDSFKPSWEAETVFGRMDPIYMFKETSRSISLAFKVPSVSSGEAYENLGKIQKLIQFLYPTYDNPAQAQTILQSPLLRVKFVNMMRKAPVPATHEVSDSDGENTREVTTNTTPTGVYGEYSMEGSGLLGIIKNITFNHNMDTDGVVEKYSTSSGEGPAGVQAILPKLIEVNLDFQPIHEHPLGWSTDSSFGKFKDEDGSTFPYGARLGVVAPPSTNPDDLNPPGPPTPPPDPPDPENLEDDENEPPTAPEEEPSEDGIDAGEDEQQAAEEEIEEDLDRDNGRCWFFCSRRGRSGDDDIDEDQLLADEHADEEFFNDWIPTGYTERPQNVQGASPTADPDEEYYGSLFSEEEEDLFSMSTYEDEYRDTREDEGYDEMRASEYEDYESTDDGSRDAAWWSARRQAWSSEE